MKLPSTLSARLLRRRPGWPVRAVMAACLSAALWGSASAEAASLVWQGAGSNTNWDLGLSSSWLQGGTPSPYADGADVFFDDTAACFTPTLTATVQPNSVTVNATSNYIWGGSGKISGAGGLTKQGTGTLRINTANAFTGNVVVDNGVLQVGNASALGPYGPAVVYVTNNGTVDFNKYNAPGKAFYIAGSGYNGQGALTDNSTTTGFNYAISNLTLLGDATIGSASRWETLAKGAIVNGNGFALTKIGPGDFWLSPGDNTNGDLVNMGDMHVMAGVLGFRTIAAVGDPTKTLTVESNAAVYLWGNPGLLNKKLVLNSGILASGLTAPESSNNWVGPITLSGTNTLAVSSAALRLWNTLSGSGGFIKSGANGLWLDGANTYTGPTFLNAGTLVLGANASLNSSSLIQVGAGLTLDVSATSSGLSRSAGQMLIGGAGATILGKVSLGSEAVLAVGNNGPGLLTVDSLTLAGNTNRFTLGNTASDTSGAVSSFLQDNGDLNLSGLNTFEFAPQGSLDTSSPYIILQYNGALHGSLANLRAVSLNPGYTITFLDPSTTAPYLEVMVSGAPQSLLWQGNNPAAPGVWDQGTANWFNTVSSQAARFYSGDLVTFDDSSSANAVQLTENVNTSMTFNNAARAYMLTGAGIVSGLLDKEGSGTLMLALSNAPALSSIVNNAGTLVCNLQGAGTYTLGATLSDNGAGQGSFIQGGSNTLVLTGDNLTYAGTLAITNGVVRFNKLNALGSPASTLYVNTQGSLDLNAVDAGLKNIAISGPGYNGQGALCSSSTDTTSRFLVGSLTLAGDATIGSSGRWNTKNGGTVTGNGFNLTKVGTGQSWFYGCRDIGVGNIEIAAGTLGFYTPVGMGDSTKTLTVDSGATLQFWNTPEYLDKRLVLNTNANVNSGYSGSGSNNFVGPVTLLGTNSFNTSSGDLHLRGSLSGSGGYIKKGAKALWLHAANTYSGPTILNASSGSLVLDVNASLGSSALVQVGSGSILDVSALTSFTLGSGQLLGGNGTVQGGNILLGSGATLKAGLADTTTYTLTVKGNLTCQAGSTNRVTVNKTTSIANDKVTGLSALTLGGTLVVVNVGNALTGGDALPLFSATSYSGGFQNIVPTQPGPGLAWDTSTLLTDGTLRVVTSVNTTPTNLVAKVTGGQLQLSWPPDHLGWRVQAQTNAPGRGLTPQWVDVPGSATNTQLLFPINPANGSVFYRMVYP